MIGPLKVSFLPDHFIQGGCKSSNAVPARAFRSQKEDLGTLSTRIPKVVRPKKIMNSYPNWFLRAATLECVYLSRQKSRCTMLE